MGGCEIKLHIAVDFTANDYKDVEDDDSLHYAEYDSNFYIQTMQAVGDILSPYDHSQ